ncbi:MAG: molybdopterin cofactor-binding domain-containing protein, partial [Pseudomonadota bacterium]
PGWAVVIADSFHAANRAASLIDIEWEAGETASVSEEDILAEGRKVIGDASKGALVWNDEGVDEAFASADSTLEAEYTTHSVLHFQLEPLNALAYQREDGAWELHTGNQWQNLILPTLAQALGTEESKLNLRTYLLGGGFGRRLNGDYIVPAALASKALGGKPVKLVFTREDDSRFDSMRSASNQKLRMAFDGEGKVSAMEHHAVAGWPTLVMAPFFMPKGANDVAYDPFSISGADHWYTVGPHRVRAATNELANATFRPGWLRSVGPGWTNWALESFIDEAAHKLGVDPIDFRLSMLTGEGRNAGEAPNSVGGAKRQAAVLREVRKLSRWGRERLPADTGVGVATSFGQERNMPTWTACVARVKVDRDSGEVKLEKLTLVTDAGLVVSPDGGRAQVEGAALWGASMALHEGTVIESGEVRDTNLGSYTPMRMRDVPELQVAFIDSKETPVGLGEPATTVVGPAIGNAIFDAVGARLREIPIRRDAVKAALKA